MTLVNTPGSGQLVGVIGAHSSDLTKVVADFLRVFEIPQISYGATASALSDKTIYSYFFRTVPPDSRQGMAMAEIIQKLGWNYVITVNSGGLYGDKGIENFIVAAKLRHICVAEKLKLSSFPTDKEYDELVRKLDGVSRARAIVMYTAIRDTRLILRALHRNNITKPFYWIGSDGWGNNLNAVENFESLAEGAITLTPLNKPVDGFEEYFRHLNVYDSKNVNNLWLQLYWETHFHCNLLGSLSDFEKNCSGNESLASSPVEFAPVQPVLNAVYAMARAVQNYVSDHCHHNDCTQLDIHRPTLLGYLKNVSFDDQATGEELTFNTNHEILNGYSVYSFQKLNGNYMYRPVGTWNGSLQWDSSKLSWPTNGSNPPDSKCSTDCMNGYYRQRKGSHDIQCCWSCEMCHLREIVRNNTCFRCPFGEVPNVNHTGCEALPSLDALSRGSSKAMLTVSMIGLMFVVVATLIFFRNNNVPLIKASSRELSGIILLGLALLFIFPWLLVAKPTPSLCICRPVVLGVALASCYAPLFMKILRIYRIFKSAQKSAGKPILISPASQVLIAVGLITIQILFSLISLFPTPPKPVDREMYNGKSLFRECSMEKDVFATLLSYNMFLMVLCTVMAFKTRRFPRNFNEAKYIGFTMYFTCFVWIIFFPSYLSSADGLHRIIWESTAVVLIGWITLIGLFGPKITHLLLGSSLLDTSDQLAVTNNTVSQAAVATTTYNKDSTLDTVHKKRDDEENKSMTTVEKINIGQPGAETTSC